MLPNRDAGCHHRGSIGDVLETRATCRSLDRATRRSYPRLGSEAAPVETCWQLERLQDQNACGTRVRWRAKYEELDDAADSDRFRIGLNTASTLCENSFGEVAWDSIPSLNGMRFSNKVRVRRRYAARRKRQWLINSERLSDSVLIPLAVQTAVKRPRLASDCVRYKTS